MRVLHAHSGNIFGGIERMLVTLTEFSDANAQHEFGLCFHDRLATELQARGATVADVGPVRFSRPWSVWSARNHLRRLLRERRPDVAVTHSPWSHAVFAPAVRRDGLPLVHWLHAPPTGGDWLERLASRHRPHFLICNSEFTCGARTRLFAGVEATTVNPPVAAPPGNRTADRGDVRRELGSSPEAVVVVQVGRIEPLKGQHRLLGALAGLRHKSNWECWLAGGPSDREGRAYLEKLRATVVWLGIEGRVRFLGERGDVPRVLHAADVFCQPNVTPESFGVAMVEALYAGLPVVATAIGGAREIVTPATGIVTPVGDDDALHEALRRVTQDPDLRRELGSAGPARARALSDPETQMRRLTIVLSRVADSKS